MSTATDSTLTVSAISAFRDNYIWMIANQTHAAVIDPGEAAPVLATLKKQSLALSAILLTHRHEDHIGGVAGLLEKNKVPVYGPRLDAIATVTHPLQEGDTIILPALHNLQITVLEVPGHTKGHAAYYARDQKWLFCGDLLFGAGCGRLFEGTPEQMFASLTRLAALPEDVHVFAGHEYTLSNLKFAHEIEPDNEAITVRAKKDLTKRNRHKPTLPSTIGLEKATNPFLRAGQEKIMDRLIKLGRLQKKDPIASFAALREWKNTYI